MTATGTPPERRGDESIAPPPCGLRLLPAWSSPLGELRENLTNFLLGRTVPAVNTASPRNHTFWRNVQLRSPFPGRGMMDSALVHLGLFSLLYAASTWPQPQLHLLQARFYRVQNGEQLSLYLPQLRGAPVHRAPAGKADPVPARQAIQSLPDEPDNLHQTIVTPPKLKLQHDVELPNLVAYNATRQPEAPAPPPPPLAPPAPAILSAPVAPKPTPPIVHLKPLRALPHSPPRAAQPAPKVSLPEKSSAPELAELVPPRAKPLLAAPPVIQRKPAIVLAKPESLPARTRPTSAQPAPPPATKLGAAESENATDLAKLFSPHAAPELSPPAPHDETPHNQTPQVVALSTHPAEIEAPVKIPEGNRQGEFAASPAGRPGATGLPGGGDSGGAGPHDSQGKVNAPPGISVEAPPIDAPLPAAPEASAGSQTIAGQPSAGGNLRSKLLAAMRTPRIASPPPRHAAIQNDSKIPDDSKPRNEFENHVFAGRRAHTLVANTPNLNSYIGSWVIRYVERNQGLAAAPIASPEVVRMSDPAYPSELIKDGIQGTVVLSAIIRADGTVGDVAVLKSLEPQLDHNAVEAFSHWLFRPALKDGKAVDLEAVITVPFRAKPIHF